jgi:hypothetical protein
VQKWARCSTAVFPLMFTFREKLSQVPLVPQNYNVMPSSPEHCSPPHVASVCYKLTGGRGGWCVSIQAPRLPGLSFMTVWSSLYCLFQHLLMPPVKVSMTSSCGMRGLHTPETSTATNKLLHLSGPKGYFLLHLPGSG